MLEMYLYIYYIASIYNDIAYSKLCISIDIQLYIVVQYTCITYITNMPLGYILIMPLHYISEGHTHCSISKHTFDAIPAGNLGGHTCGYVLLIVIHNS